MTYQLPTLPAIPSDFVVERPNVRALAQEHHMILQVVSAGGGNIHQAALDQQDRILDFIRGRPEEEANRFSQLYSEELDALTAEQELETQKVLAETAAIERSMPPVSSTNVTTWIALIAFFVAVVALIKIMK
jgi:hypothetical protein